MRPKPRPKPTGIEQLSDWSLDLTKIPPLPLKKPRQSTNVENRVPAQKTQAYERSMLIRRVKAKGDAKRAKAKK